MVAALTLVASARGAGEIDLTITDATTRSAVAARMTLITPRGTPLRPRGTIGWKGHFVTDGTLTLRMPPGKNSFVVERGLEYRAVRGHIEIAQNGEDIKQITLTRFANLRDEGWWSGDLDLQRPHDQLPLLMNAEDLYVGIVGGSTAEGPTSIGEDRLFDERNLVVADKSNVLLLCRYPESATVDRTEQLGAVAWARRARSAGGHVCVGAPSSWDLPVLVAHELVDSVAVMNRQTAATEPASPVGRIPDKRKYPAPRGQGRWSQEIYFHLLNCGLKIPCVAGSGSGVTAAAAGQARTYVHCGSTADLPSWWRALEEGRTSITNGPLLRPRCDGQYPGHTFTAEPGATLELQLQLTLSTRTRIDYLEIIQDGQILHHIRLPELAKSSGQLPKVPFTSSGWLAVQAVTSTADTYEFAQSAPFYVQIGDQPRVSAKSAQFFVDWVQQRLKEPDAEQPEVRTAAEEGLKFWQQRLAEANAP
ncbi:MAG: CehA/McbA family metallohydrolase [Pirellulales bacterium]